MEATTLQCFMISSLFSKNKDVVGLFPMKNQTATDLLPILHKILEILKLAGYAILTIISDNNRINRKAFEIMCGGSLKSNIENPYDPEKQIFILFDTVHLMKSIRNNWLNNTETNQTFYIPAMKFLPPGQAIKTVPAYASILHLKQLYNQEKECSVKLAPSLTRKSLFPNHLERQDVQTALKLFDDKLIPALQMSKSKIGEDLVGTMHFIDIFSKWWKIINVKAPEKGKHKRNLYCDPVIGATCHIVQFLEEFCLWLQEWKNLPSPYFAKPNSRCGKLSKETLFALLHTTRTLINLITYLFKEHKPSYILLGKFQTDCIEARFGQYRCMSGGNYHIGVSQVLESERKLKLLSLMTLKCNKMGTFQIKSFLEAVKDATEIIIFVNRV
ncbi:transposable element P transposase [Parasteatoda tepidariorum]|uniref:transposable element P transposase n=1 Tax=Parasteatoda tepidariorum TaxID=114398 RepID=UPI001C727B5B|nr:uncharacterized protein LOC122269119 [Parasteatoda tepidariorum]